MAPPYCSFFLLFNHDFGASVHQLSMLMYHYRCPTGGVRFQGGCLNYPYTEDLLELERRHPPTKSSTMWFEGVSTPLVVDQWAKFLLNHPDTDYRDYLLKGLKSGFHIGFDYANHTHESAKANMKSAQENPAVVNQYIQRELACNRFIGPVNPSLVNVNRFGVIPKRHQPGKWRLITDLSHPPGLSINDGIEPRLCSVHYSSVDEAVGLIREKGHAVFLAKVDIENAYRLVPVHPDDRHLLGMSWNQATYVDTALPFGLRTAPKIFNALADALHWILSDQGVSCIHYLDDFLLVGASEPECTAALEKTREICSVLGVPLALHKTEGPTTCLSFLGIELDTRHMILRLPRDKLARLQAGTAAWHLKRACTKRDLLSLIGQLQHASCIVKPGRSFLRRMIQLSTVVKAMHHHIRLNKNFRSDLQWWSLFLPGWNGTSMMDTLTRSHYAATITSDASGSWGCGAYDSQGSWLQLQWPTSWIPHHITIKELLPVVLAIAMWGHKWSGGVVRCLCDNAAVVAILRSSTSKHHHAMHLVRCSFFFLAKYNLSLLPMHIPGKANIAADAISRNNMEQFLVQVPAANQSPDTIPATLIHTLVDQCPDWTSATWTDSLRSFFSRVLPSPRNEPIVVAKKDT